ncbi:MAG: SprT family zinc-dependent metalloprotease [Clostridia bacterium]|nr:SprT family zinc-dependent metalloprotease [Clostridia bacterium]
MAYELIRSSRKTLAIQIKNGQVIVRAPLRASEADIHAFLLEHQAWIQKHLAQAEARQQTLSSVQKLTPEDIRQLARQAVQVIPGRVEHYARMIGVTYGRITIRNQRSKWGSCSSLGNLNFNCLLMLAPLEVLDSVIVHELCHRKEMNHSQRFYAEVLRVYPDYKHWNQWLKDNGAMLMAMMP